MYASGLSAIACEVVSNYADESSTTPVSVISKDLPGWLTDEFTVILVSCDDAKDDIKKAYHSIKERGCDIITLVPDKFSDMFSKDGNISIGVPSSSSAVDMIGTIVGTVASLLQKIGVCRMKDDLKDIIGVLKTYRDEIPNRSKEALKCISGIVGNVVAIYSPSNITASALWWKYVMNERLGSVTFIGTMPEFNHNELVGWSSIDMQHRRPSMILIHDRHATEMMANMMGAMRSVLSDNGTDVCAIPACGKSTLEKNLRSMILGEHIARSLECMSKAECTPNIRMKEISKDIEVEINDPSDTRGQIFNTVDDLAAALKCDLDPMPGYENILLCGMGGSGISNDIIRDYGSLVSSKYIYVLKFPTVPNWVDRNTLVVVSSYSGETQETLEIYDEVVRRGCRIVVMTSGGQLVNKAKERSDVIIPLRKGIQPRHAVGSMVGHLACVMEAVGEPQVKENIQAVMQSLREYRDELCEDTPNNPAMMIAQRIADKIPVVYSNGPSDAIVLRWKSQISENSKKIAFVSPPSGGEKEGRKILDETHLAPIVLMISSENDEALAEIQTRDLNGNVQVIDAGGNTLIERMIRLTMLGDYVSLYLAYLKGVDPTDVKPIKDLKRIIGSGNSNS